MKSEEFSLSNFSKRHVNFFKKEGYIVAKNIINVKDIQSLRKSIFTVLEKILKSQKINIKINIKNIDKEMILLRQKNPNLFAKFFDTLQTLSSIYLTVSSNKIINVASKLLKVKNYQTTLTDVGVRLDVPNDNKNTLGWHQDTSYYRQNSFGKNGLVLWVPIFKINKNMGSLQHLRFSHNLGPLNIKKSKKSSAFASSKREINSKKLIKYKQILQSVVSVKDALIMNLDMVHRSGNNSDENKVRVTMLARFHNVMSRDFNPGYNIYKYSNKKFNFDIHGF